MPSRTSETPPTPTMPGWKAFFSFVPAVLFDFLTLIFTFLVFTGPFIAAEAAKIYLASKGWPPWISGLAFYLAGGGTAAVEVLQPEIAGAIEALGTLMAMLIGFAGGLFMALWFWIFCRLPPWTKSGGSNLLWMGFGWITKMIPFVDMLPTLTFSTWRIVSNQKKADREALKKWEEANATRVAESQREVRQTQIVRGQEAVALATEQAALAANEDAVEIPERVPRAA